MTGCFDQIARPDAVAAISRRHYSGGDLNLVDMQLKEFNYSDMDNLKIDSDDDGISV